MNQLEKYYKKDNTWFYKDKNEVEKKVGNKALLNTLEEGDINLEGVESKPQINGLGDLISRVTKALGIDECDGCKERKRLLNDTYPFLKPRYEKVTEADVIMMIELNSAGNQIVKSETVDKIYEFYNRLFNAKKKRSNCPGCLKVMLDQINSKLEL